MTSSFTNRSASITSFKTVNGQELALKFDNVANYASKHNQFLGSSIGRVANRIYGGGFEAAGKFWELPCNDNKGELKVTLHGGHQGWDKRDWEGPFEETRADGKKSVVYKIHSAHLDQGFPGTIDARAIYTPYIEGEKAYLEIEYEAELTDDTPVDETVVSLTNHNFFNLTGDFDSYDGTQIKIFSTRSIHHDPKTTECTGTFVTDSIVPTDQSFFTLTKEAPFIDKAYETYDVNDFKQLDTRFRDPQPVVHMFHPRSKVHLQILTTEPVFQVYTGDGMKVPVLEGETVGHPGRSGVAVEPARPTNAANHPHWRQWVNLKKGDKWGSKTVYVNWVEK
jgi:aldose 1-epimerase